MIPREAILAKVPDFYGEEVEAHLNLMPERYFSYHNVDEIVLHLHMVHRLLETIADADSLGALAPVVDWHDDLNLGLTVVHIVTWDRAGLFYKLAGAFSLAGLNIVSAKALTRADHITIDTFYVTELDGGVVRNAGARDVFRQHLDAALLHNKDLMPDILRLAGDMREPAWRRRHTRLPAPLPPHIEVFHDIDLRRTIIEVQCSDEPGLLYRLTKAIYDHGFDISFARIATERHVAVDTFHIESVPGAAGEEADRLLELRGQLETIIRAVAPDAVVN
jgi:[protein-PII] uridylyltransferase